VNGFAFILLLAAAPQDPVDFDTEVLPVLAKAGCNAGACHGAAAGRGGFKLSLFGGDPAADHRAIARDLEGRRVNLAHPDRSLLLLKPTWQLDHEGGQRFEADSPQARLLTEWIAAGAPRKSTRRLVDLVVAPANPALESLPGKLSLTVTAQFDDGTSRRVEHLAIFTPADSASTQVDEEGHVDVLRPGRYAIVVRFLTHVKAIQVTSAQPARALDLTALPRNNWIDDEINATLATLHLPPAPRANDAALLRRATLDLTGRLPSPVRVREYLADTNREKFEREVDRLLLSKEFAAYWSFKLAHWLRLENTAGGDKASRLVYFQWLQQQVAAGRPLTELAAELLTAEGDSHAMGPPNFHRAGGDARGQAEHVAETLLAVRLRCANCHNHPLDRWTQDDYHGLAAIFARLDRGQVVRLRSSGEVIHPATGEAALPRIPGERFLDRESDGRQALAEWLGGQGRPYFAKAWINRVWESLLGRGLVHPADDLRDTNPATHPELLAHLTEEFSKSGGDLRAAVRLIVMSATYQRSSASLPGSPRDDRYYSRALHRSLPREVLLDALGDATGIPFCLESRSKGPSSLRAIESVALGCEPAADCGRFTDSAVLLDELSAQADWLNGPLVNARLAEPGNAFTKLANSDAPVRDVVEQYYLRTLSRPPTAQEAEHWARELGGADRAQACEDLAWSLLSCPEFVTNH
jgi:hypothetical protein